MKNSTNNNAKIIKILKKMDDVLMKNGYHQYQERIHRIYKTVLSIHRHTDCVVSKFNADLSIAPDDEEGTKSGEEINQENFQSAYLSFQGDNEIEVENEGNSKYTFELDDLLKFIEDELNMQNLCNDSTSSDGSNSENDSGENPGNSKLPLTGKKQNITKENMQKKFFKIELKLRSYIEEQEMMKKNFESILNGSKSPTPLGKMPHNPPPVLIRNFFDDRESLKKELEAAQKRYSVRGPNLKAELEKFDELMRKKPSISEIPTIKHTKQAKSNVSSFNEEVNLKVESTAEPAFSFFKRNSIFYEQNLGTVEEEKGLDESEEYEGSCSDEEGEYEEEKEEEEDEKRMSGHPHK
jgi:hypothetical protein